MFIDESDNNSFSITGLEEYRDIIALCQSKHSYTRSVYIRERRASRRRRIHYKSRMHNRKGENQFFFFFSFNPTFHSFRRNKNSILQRLDE